MMPTARGIIFDLDGTLVDSAPDLIGASNRMLSCWAAKQLIRQSRAAGLATVRDGWLKGRLPAILMAPHQHS